MTTMTLYALLNKKIQSSNSGIQNISTKENQLVFDLTNGQSFTVDIPSAEIDEKTLSDKIDTLLSYKISLAADNSSIVAEDGKISVNDNYIYSLIDNKLISIEDVEKLF